MDNIWGANWQDSHFQDSNRSVPHLKFAQGYSGCGNCKIEYKVIKFTKKKSSKNYYIKELKGEFLWGDLLG